jgi:hypothetical protein
MMSLRLGRTNIQGRRGRATILAPSPKPNVAVLPAIAQGIVATMKFARLSRIRHLSPEGNWTYSRDEANWRNERRGRIEYLVVQDHIDEGAVNFQSAVVVNEAEFLELVHEPADIRTRCSDHLG